MDLTTYPLNDVDYSAEDAELFHCTRSSGIYAADDFAYSVTGADCNIAIGTGIGWIRNSKFSGKVIALKEATTLDLGLSDAVYPRIDAVVIQFNAATNKTEIVVKNGTAATSPVAPEVIQTESVYELHLYQIKRSAGAAVVTASDITDLRKDSKYCGLMADSVTMVDADHTHSADDIDEGTLSSDRLPIVPITKGGTGNTEGKAASAEKLETARTVQVNLASNTAASFDGTEDVKPGVTGVLPVANGGTGASTAAAALSKLGALPASGGTVTGKLTLKGVLVLTQGVHYGTASQRPSSPVEGQLYWRVE